MVIIPKGHYSENTMMFIIPKDHYSENGLTMTVREEDNSGWIWVWMVPTQVSRTWAQGER